MHILRQRSVDHVQDEIRDERLLQRRRESLDELGRQPTDEPDGVRHEVALPVVLEPARGRVERLEEPVLDRHVGAGERVQERRLADVRVPGERNGRRSGAGSRLAARRAVRSQLAEPAPQLRDPAVREPAVGLELRLARAARADASADLRGPAAAGEPLEVLPHAAHAREVVLELRELHLELSLGRASVLREDVEDQLRPVDDACGKRVLEDSAAASAGAPRRRAGPRRPPRRTPPSAPRACPSRRSCAGRAARGAGRAAPTGLTPAARASSRSSASSCSSSAPFASTASRSPRSGSGPTRRSDSTCAMCGSMPLSFCRYARRHERARRPAGQSHARARGHSVREPPRGGCAGAPPRAGSGAVRAAVRGRRGVPVGAANVAPASRSSSSRATTTPFPRRTTSRAGSPRAPCTGVARAT